MPHTGEEHSAQVQVYACAMPCAEERLCFSMSRTRDASRGRPWPDAMDMSKGAGSLCDADIIFQLQEVSRQDALILVH